MWALRGECAVSVPEDQRLLHRARSWSPCAVRTGCAQTPRSRADTPYTGSPLDRGNWTPRVPSAPVKPVSRLMEQRILQGLLIGETGFEPATARPPAGCATRLRHSPMLFALERATGIEPALRAWKAPVQPQHFARVRTVVILGQEARTPPLGKRARYRSSPGSRP